MNKYKVSFEGYAFVEADNEEEAQDKYYNEEELYKENRVLKVEEVEEFEAEY